MTSKKKFFGTDGIRGKANIFPITADFMLRLGQAIGLFYKRHYARPKIIIGKDTRQSCYMLEQALSSGLCSVGVHTVYVGPLPTPGIAYLTKGVRAHAGIVISASHNPFYDNGIKLFSADGYKLASADELAIEGLIGSIVPSMLSLGSEIGTSSRIDDAVGQYVVFLKEQFPRHLSLDSRRIVLDCANGAAYKVAPRVFTELGAQLQLLAAEPNGSNINDVCGALSPSKLRKKVIESNADLGIALDGDADRLVIVDECGEVVDGDELLAIFAKDLLTKELLRHNTVVATHMSNLGFEKAINDMGATLLRTDIGDRNVAEAMRRKNLSLGGEQSGHLIFGDLATTGDGILAALKLLEIVLETEKPVSELKTIVSKYPQAIKSFEVPEKVPLKDLSTLNRVLRESETKLKGGTSSGRIIFRYSGTEKKARIMIEGDDVVAINNMAEELSNVAISNINQLVTTDKSVTI